MKVRPIILLGTGAYSGPRKESCDRLVAELTAQCHVAGVEFRLRLDGSGSTECWLELLKYAVTTDATHVTCLPDDVHLVPHFVEVLVAAIAGKPDEIICCLSNHEHASTVQGYWYTTAEGFTGFGGTMPMPLMREFLEWRQARFRGGEYPADASVNLFAMLRGKLIHKPLPSLMQHDTDLPSTVGNDWQNTSPKAKLLRKAQVWEPKADLRGVDWTEPATELGPTFEGQCWDIVRALPPEDWDIDAMYQAYRPVPPAGKLKVVIIVPTYGEPHAVLQETQPSRDAVMADLEAHGVECAIIEPRGDSHVDRMRQHAMHQALKEGATHVLWWDADIGCDNPTTVRAMLLGDCGIVAGACPYKLPGGRVVHNLWPQDEAALKRGEPLETRGGFVEVLDAGSGFMLMSRRAIITMMEAYKECSYITRAIGVKGEPIWTLWDATLAGDLGDVNDRQFLSEDWSICRLWQHLGGKVYVFAPATFKHWGLYPYAGSFEQHYGLRRNVHQPEGK